MASPLRLRVARAAALCALLACGDPAPAPPDVGALPPLPTLASAPAEAPRAAARPVRELAIALVGEVRGEIEPCGCPTLPYGGMARRQVLLDRLRQADRPLFHLDAGELLLKGRTTTRSEQRESRAALLMALSAQVGVDAWAPGPSDLLALGEDGLTALAAGRLDAPPALSATLESPDGALILPPSRVVERGGVRLAVIGLTPAVQGRDVRAFARARPLADAARAALDDLPADVDLVVGLGPLADDEADALAAAVPELDLLLTTRGQSVDLPRSPAPDGPLVVETPDRGRYLQMVTLRLGTDRDQPLLRAPPAEAWRERATSRQQAAHAPDDPARQQALAQVEARFEEIGHGRNLVSFDALPLGEDLDPPEDRARPAASGGGTLADRIASFKAQTVEQAAAAAAAPAEPGVQRYASSGACVTCHAQEFARWSYSGHAQAWLALVREDEEHNPECVGCHTTAFGEPGGFGALTEGNLRKWKAVQCEACHGPLAGHPDDRTIRPQPVTAQGCVRCHDAANSPGFDFATYLPKASCQPTERAPVAPQ